MQSSDDTLRHINAKMISIYIWMSTQFYHDFEKKKTTQSIHNYFYNKKQLQIRLAAEKPMNQNDLNVKIYECARRML